MVARKLFAGAALMLGMLVAIPYGTSHATTQQSANVATEIKVTITTGGGLFGPVKHSYQVGEQIPITITMTNLSGIPQQVCDSATFYQDRPTLRKDGTLIPYTLDQNQTIQTMEKDKTCAELDLPDPITLKLNESRVVDWFILADSRESNGGPSWYAPLEPGKYELSSGRRLGCCNGPMVQSNTINFEVVP